MAVHEHRKLCTQNSVLSRPTVLCNSIINGEIALRNIAFHTFLDDVRKMLVKCANYGLSYEHLSRVYFLPGHSVHYKIMITAA